MGRRTPHAASFTAAVAKQVCSPAVAHQLKEVAVPQDSLWYWVASRRGQYPLLCTAEEVAAMPLFHRVAVSAFTVGELGELLPSSIEQSDEVLRLRCAYFTSSLPLISLESCHPFQCKSATDFTRILPP